MDNRRTAKLIAIFAGLLYGLFARWFFKNHNIMSASFIYGVPLAIGFVTVYIAETRERRDFGASISLPVVPALLSLAFAALVAWEGAICIILWLPVYLILAMVGGFLASLIRRTDPKDGKLGLVFSVLIPLGPFGLEPIENLFPAHKDFRVVANTVEINADERRVWDEIKSVRAIDPSELQPSFTHRMGFPRPIAATLSYEGVGGVRRATFEGGVVFNETVTRWEPGERLVFSIKADTSAIPPTTLDEHVTVGGPFFDVLEGEYRIEQIGPRRVRLHLQSRHRISTHFNGYGALWTDFIMGDIQASILKVIRDRSEKR